MSIQSRITMIIMTVFAIAAIPFNVIVLGVGDIGIVPKIGAGLNVIALAYLVAYMLMGFKKEGSTSFKGFMIFFTATLLAEIASVGSGAGYWSPTVVVTLFALAFASTFMLTLSKDLGKTKSMILCGVTDVITIILLIVVIIFAPGVKRGGNLEGSVFFVRGISMVISSVIMTLMTNAKFTDKIARGREV